MSALIRLFDNIKQTIRDTRDNRKITKEMVYNYYYNKLYNATIDKEFFLNGHDYEILKNAVNSIHNKHTKSYIESYLNMYQRIEDRFEEIPLSNLQYYYQNHYNRLKTLHEIKSYHLSIPNHISLLEEELFRTVYDMRNLMFFLFGSLRQVLQSGCEVFVLETYASPQTTFRKLDSIQELPIVDKKGYSMFIESQSTLLEEKFEELSSMLDLFKEQVELLLIYYQEFDIDFASRCVNETGNPYSTNMYAPPIDYNERAEQLRALKDIVNPNQR